MIYMDNAATTVQKPKEVAEAVFEAVNSMGNAGRGAAGPSMEAARVIYDARVKLTRLFGADKPGQIAFTCNSTEALNMAIKGTIKRGDHVISTVMEHNSVLRPLYECREKGAELTILGCDEKGNISYEEMEHAVRKNTKAIVCTHASNLTGNMIDLAYVGQIASKNRILFIVDASQTAGIFPIDVQRQQIDILCFTGHKGLLGPQGTGGLYVREGVEIPTWKSGGSGVDTYNTHHPAHMPEALEAGTLNGHGLAGLSAAVSYIERMGPSNIRAKELSLTNQFYRGISCIPDVTVYGDFDTELRCPIVSMNIGDYDSAEVADALYQTYGIATRSGAHCAPLMHRALGTAEQGAVRFSFSHYNTEEEVESAICAVRELATEV